MSKINLGTALSNISREHLGQQLRYARTSHQLSLREMGKRVGVSASFISQIELGQASPSIGTLYAIVSELNLSLDALLGSVPERPTDDSTPVGPVNQPVSESQTSSLGERLPKISSSSPAMHGFQPADNRPEINVGGVRWERLTSADDALTEFLRVTYVAGSESCSENNLMRHGGWEYIHVLEGSIDVQVLFTTQTLQAGDSLNFDSTAPHRISNPYDDECVAIWVVVGRNGFHHPLHGKHPGEVTQNPGVRTQQGDIGTYNP